MIIQKFGGTSVGSAERMKSVAKLIMYYDRPRIVVLSAMSGTTNSLSEISEYFIHRNNDAAIERIELLSKKYLKVVDELFSTEEYKKKGNELIDNHFNYLRSFAQDMSTPNEVKCILAQGELLSSALFHYYLEEQQVKSILLPALNFMRIDREGEPDNYYIKENLKRELDAHPDTNLFITQGFICRNNFGEIDNLKRGGSDYSASIIGAVVKADEVQIWTDIDGFHDNDPRIVEKTHTIPELSFDEAAELAYFGAKILHPSTIQPAKAVHIPVVVKNTLDPEAPGTTITQRTTDQAIKAVAAKDGITAIRVKSGRMLLAYGFLNKVFEVFEVYKTPIDMITTSEISVSITIDDTTHLSKIVNDLKHYGIVEIDKEMSIICRVGEGITEEKDATVKVFGSLTDVPIRMISYGGSQNNISILIPTVFKSQALNSLSKNLFF
jgi:aspartate kinase